MAKVRMFVVMYDTSQIIIVIILEIMHRNMPLICIINNVHFQTNILYSSKSLMGSRFINYFQISFQIIKNT
jgi:hypothetical protein